jgi:hypothetical protein
MIRESAKTEFWGEVQLCLEGLFCYSKSKAASATKELRKDLEDLPVGDIFYHSEPLDVACDIAGEKPSDELRAKYSEISKESGW